MPRNKLIAIFTFMKLKYFLCLVALLFVTASDAQLKAKMKKVKTPFKLVEAYTQKTAPGIPGELPETGHHFIIIWQAATYPETFFWRGENGWMACKIEKAKKVTNRKGVPRGIDYTTKPSTGDDIKKGDTLAITPVRGGKFPIPAEIPQSATNTLFFKTGGSGWLSYKVTTIGKKPDVVAP
jgi:hypothetical protein